MNSIFGLPLLFVYAFVEFDGISDASVAIWVVVASAAIATLGWITLALMLAFVRAGAAQSNARNPVPAILALIAATVASTLWQTPEYWTTDNTSTDPSTAQESSSEHFAHLAPDALAEQMKTLDVQLAALPKQRPGVIDVYVITYAPYASENVFLNESKIVARVMRERFDAEGRIVQLVNHKSTITTNAWASPENLQRTLDHIGTLIDPAEDIVFLHLTSHGSKTATLETEFWPLPIDSLTAGALRGMLDDAKILSRVISVSACYSGTWIDSHQTPSTLIMTASDATHTSYGCGHKSEVTFFTRAVFDEQL
ncbi:MAG: C13 family peptidase, partial [Casimicrobium sp.]